MLEFTSFDKHRQGIIVSLLSKSYGEYFRHDPACESVWKRAWEDYDRAVFEHPDTIGACGFITSLNAQAIGFASWDPRQYPVGIIGHNCILPEFRGKTYGCQQVKEVLRILKNKGFMKVRVTTSEHQFFAPAQRMYEACGFREIRRGFKDENSVYGTITYEFLFASSE